MAKLKKIPSEAELVGFTEDLHRRLWVGARNVLLEYRLGSKQVPVEVVEKLMRLYGEVVARDIFDSLREPEPEGEKSELQKIISEVPKLDR